MTGVRELDGSSANKTRASELLLATGESAWPFFAYDEIEAAVRVLRSAKVNYWTGEEGRLFENEFAEFVGCKHAIAGRFSLLAIIPETAPHTVRTCIADSGFVPSLPPQSLLPRRH